jgi:hypothetical protein
MKNHEHITPEQQIENQRAEIESLNRKVDSLERELQKYQTEADKYRPALNYQYRSGESRLLQQIQTLEKQLADCLEKKPDPAPPIRTPKIEATIRMACAAPFMPKWRYREGGGREFPPKHSQWRYLQRMLVESDSVSHYWFHKSFKKVLTLVNYVTDKTAIQEIPGLKAEQYVDAAEDLGSHFCYCDQDDHDALVLLKEILENFKGTDDWFPRWYAGDFDDVLVSVSLIIACQAIYLSCQEEPEPKKEPEATE